MMRASRGDVLSPSPNTGHLKDAFTDDDLLVFIRNIYGVLLTRGMLGTYVYVCDEGLRARLRSALP